MATRLDLFRDTAPEQDPVLRPLRVCFLLAAQLHQVPHALGPALALARRAGFAVDIRVASRAHLDLIAPLLPADGPAPGLAAFGAPILRGFARLRGSTVPPKTLTLASARRELDGYDAIVLPERTSLRLRRMGVTRPRFIHVDHGAGDRAVGFDPRISAFDFVLVAGEKQRRRMLREGLIRTGAHAISGYAKFQVADAMRPPGWTPFAHDLPVILYNPHFCPRLGSWSRQGIDIIHAIAASGRYNLIVAPHLRMFDRRRDRRRAEALLAPLARDPRVHIDLGSTRSIDMTYTELADIYLGDVSSQVYEFLRRPRPCVFVNAHDAAWQGDENYAHWRYGDVVTDPAALLPAIDAAAARHPAYVWRQRAGFRTTFARGDACELAADAIAGFCRSDRAARM